jgi:uncharacterized repeat protein (TIGR03847 family)
VAEIVEFDRPERFVVGTVGQPGEREFFLQARDPRRLVSVRVEKDQVAVLADRLTDLLDEVLEVTDGEAPIPVEAPATLDIAGLDVPIEPVFRVGTMALAWDADDDSVVVEVHDVEDEAGGLLRVRLSGGQARSFVERTRHVVAAGRPPCPFCALPLDPQGHICPRANGYRRRA